MLTAAAGLAIFSANESMWKSNDSELRGAVFAC
jgi:hypothetical protein